VGFCRGINPLPANDNEKDAEASDFEFHAKVDALVLDLRRKLEGPK
jgi:hypothetical protein